MKFFNLFLLFAITINSQTLNWIKVADNLNFPEGPAWDGSNTLYVSSCHGGYITKIVNDKPQVFIDSSEKSFKNKQTNGLTIYKDGSIYACEFGIGAILKITPDGATEIMTDKFDGQRYNRPNDLIFDNKGFLYFTDPKSYGTDKLDGRVFRLNIKTKEVNLVADSIAYSNGIAFSLDCKTAYVCESAKERVIQFDVNEDGSFSNKRAFIHLPGGDPDGLALDVEGNVYVAHFGEGKIYKVSHEGKILNTYITPGKKISNLEFCGKDLKTLYITEDESNSVYKIQWDVQGHKLFSSPD